MQTPLQIFSWRKPFLPALKNYIAQISDDNPGSVTIITPNSRPARYLLDLYGREKKSVVVPRVLPMNEVTRLWRNRDVGLPERVIGVLDMIPHLRQLLLDLAASNIDLARELAAKSVEYFLPWGARLANLLEELFQNGLSGADLANTEGDISGFAAAILAVLGQTAEKWRAFLNDRRWTTPAYDSFLAAKNAANIPPPLLPSQSRRVIIAGFYALNGAENALLKSLWQNGAHLCLHTDPALANGLDVDWACQEHANLIRSWRAKTELWPDPAQDADPQINFFAAYDTHSQMEELKRRLAASDDKSSAIVLNSPDLLAPTLHALPDKNVNISIGYPLERTPLNSLIVNLFEAAASRDDKGAYYWKDLLKLVRQPYFAMLTDADGESLRPALREIDKQIRSGAKYVDLDQLIASLEIDAEERIAIERLCDVSLRAFAEADSLAKAGATLANFCSFLIAGGEDIWSRFPLDAEALARFKFAIAPKLIDCDLANVTFSSPALIGALVAQAARGERVPFAADPLVGAQVIGMLETRLLQFDKIYLLDANDDALPGSPPRDPLLPDSLRPVLGLPDAGSAQRVAAHNLFRLCACAKEVNFFWEEGVSHSALFDGKKTRSRFVEQLIWKEEKKRKKILETGSDVLKTANISLNLPPTAEKAISAEGAIKTALKNYLQKGASPSALDTYLTCPYKFVTRYLLGIRDADEVNEGEDPAFVGELIHETLRRSYEPYVGKELAKKNIKPETLEAIFKELLETDERVANMPADSRFLLEIVAPRAFKKFLEEQPEKTEVVAVEKNFDAKLNIGDTNTRLYGVMDRLDRRDGGLCLLDYKTGRIKEPQTDLWQDEEFFLELSRYCQNNAPWDDEAEGLYAKLIERLPSCQLPCYVVMLKKNYNEPVTNAAYVELKDSCKEKGVFVNLNKEAAAKAEEYCELAVEFILRRMVFAREFATNRGDWCLYCEYAGICGI